MAPVPVALACDASMKLPPVFCDVVCARQLPLTLALAEVPKLIASAEGAV